MSTDLHRIAAHLRHALDQASHGLIERELVVELIALAAVAREHVLIVGPPGTGKSEAVRRVARALQGRYFEYLLGRFTEPMELFGPVDLRRLREGEVVTDTTGMLPEAEIAFLDEIFLGSTAILNTLLGLLNERRFRRGHTDIAVPLRLAVGASNALPEDVSLAAFADRFLVRIFVESVPEPRLEELLLGGWNLMKSATDEAASIAELDVLAAASREVDLLAVRGPLAHAVRKLRRAGIELSDRRAVAVQRLIAAAATLDGRTNAGPADLWPLIHVLPTAEAQAAGRDRLRDLLGPSRNSTLQHAAEEASLGPLARADRLVATAEKLLAAQPDQGRDDEAWRLHLEGVAREIDATFARADLPPTLAALRQRLIEVLGG